MPRSVYYFLDCLVRDDSARVTIRPEVDTTPGGWRTGAVLTLPSATLMKYRIARGEEGELPPYVDEAAPLMSNELIGALRSAGIDNLQLFDAAIEEAATGKIHPSHKAVNVVGLVNCAERDDSDPTGRQVVIDLERAYDLALFRLVEPGARLVVHRRIKDRLERSGIGTKIDFHATGRSMEVG